MTAAPDFNGPWSGQGERTLVVNGKELVLDLEPRVSLLDALREFAGVTGPKKGCNQGACGACTVLVDGGRVISCLVLAIQCEGREIVTVEGLAAGDELHPLQRSFITHDGFQCGYCTPGQLCSAIGMVDELRSGLPSAVTEDVRAERAELTEEEIRERMSGNLCRCGAYGGIVAPSRRPSTSRRADEELRLRARRQRRGRDRPGDVPLRGPVPRRRHQPGRPDAREH